MGKSPTISIVSTVYNTQPFLEQAVRSILAQTFPDFELLLIDDGSSDDSGRICDALAAEDARIRVFHQANGGPASARNKGLDNARGRYIGFVDSDDVIEPTMYEVLYRAVQAPGVRLAACSGDCIDEAGRPLPGRRVAIREHGIRPAEELLLETFQTGSFYGPLSWNKLFDIRTFRDKGVRYDESMFFGDDASVLHLVFEGERAVCLPDVLYHYRTRRGQMTDAATFPPRKLDDLRMYWEWLQYFAARPGSALYYRWAVAWYWKALYLFWCLAGAAGNQAELRDGFEVHRKHLAGILPDLVRDRYVPYGERLRACLFCRSPELAYRLARAWGRLAGPRRPA